jgi:hypothetical protein
MEKYYLNEDSDYEPGVPSIVDSYNDKEPLPSLVDRYFSRYYLKKKSQNGDNEDHLLLCHTNRVGLVMLAKSHVAFKKGIVNINYNIGNCDRSSFQVKGKHKKGGMHLEARTTIAIVKCSDGSEYKIVSMVNSKLLFVNEKINDDLSKLALEGFGYVAVILIKAENIEKLKDVLICEADYSPE